MKPSPPRLGLAFFRQDAATVARHLVGCILARTLENGRLLRARIVETEAYVGIHDLACHASKGRTPRTEILFGPAGHAYVYFIYGMHEMLNVVTGPRPKAPGQAVLIRAAEPLDGFTTPLPNLAGPARLTRAFQITRTLNGIEVTSDALHFEPRPPHSPAPRIKTSPRIGVDYAGDWAFQHLRFYDVASRMVSKAPARSGLKKRSTPRITDA